VLIFYDWTVVSITDHGNNICTKLIFSDMNYTITLALLSSNRARGNESRYVPNRTFPAFPRSNRKKKRRWYLPSLGFKRSSVAPLTFDEFHQNDGEQLPNPLNLSTTHQQSWFARLSALTCISREVEPEYPEPAVEAFASISRSSTPAVLPVAQYVQEDIELGGRRNAVSTSISSAPIAIPCCSAQVFECAEHVLCEDLTFEGSEDGER
jgi:hypothetical protein